jgi:hypothetical protein
MVSPHLAPGCARNTGVAASQAELLFFLDGNDLFLTVWFPVVGQRPALTSASAVQRNQSWPLGSASSTALTKRTTAWRVVNSDWPMRTDSNLIFLRPPPLQLYTVSYAI